MSPDGSKSTPPPEEKLLGLIRGKEPASTRAQQGAPAALAGLSEPSAEVGGRLPAWWLRGLNIGLGCLIVGEMAVIVRMVTMPVPSVSLSIPKPTAPHTGKPAGTTGFAESLPSLASAVSRPLFQPAGMASTSARPGEATAAAPSAQAKALAARLTVIGVVAGNPAQAIIEDAQIKKTYFVSVGQPVVEGLIVQEIRDGRVVLDLQGEKIELSL